MKLLRHVSNAIPQSVTQRRLTMDELKALARLINDSVEEIERSCNARNVSFPSLSEKFTPENEAARADPVVVQAAGHITAAASQLIALARPAPATLFTKSIQLHSLTAVLPCIAQISRHIMQFHVPSALGFIVEAKFVEILRPTGSKGSHVNEIARKAKVNANKLGKYYIMARAFRARYKILTHSSFSQRAAFDYLPRNASSLRSRQTFLQIIVSLH